MVRILGKKLSSDFIQNPHYVTTHNKNKTNTNIQQLKHNINRNKQTNKKAKQTLWSNDDINMARRTRRKCERK